MLPIGPVRHPLPRGATTSPRGRRRDPQGAALPGIGGAKAGHLHAMRASMGNSAHPQSGQSTLPAMAPSRMKQRVASARPARSD
eukprot:12260785-Alexandrium_andersonii.AAC.1